MIQQPPADLLALTAGNRSFSKSVPGLQLAIDSTSLGEFKTCPKKYYWSIIRGLRPKGESVHLTFGLLLHGGVERYAHARAQGASHDNALHQCLRWALSETWNKELSRPWASDHPSKNRLSLIRTLVWYLEQYGANDPMTTVILPNGKPAVELSFSFDSGIHTDSTGEAWVFCGHLDRLATLNDVPYIVDIKTSVYAIDAKFFAKFSPDNQFSMYTLASRVAFAVPVQGIIVDGAQVGATFSRFGRHIVNRDQSTVEEWLADTGIWLRQMEQAALAAHWPMNDKMCEMYGGCPFRALCARAPASRESWIASDYLPRVWDPLQRRGDI